MDADSSRLLAAALLSICLLIFLAARLGMTPFLALILASLAMGLGGGLAPAAVATHFQQGMGAMLGDIAAVIAMGAILGRLLEKSGAARVIARRLLPASATSGAGWRVAGIAFLIGLPVFFGVGLVLLIPIVMTMAAEARLPLARLGLPLVVGLSVSHGFTPPHPGPMAAIAALGADTGRTLLWGVLIGLPIAFVCGPLLGSRLADRFAPAAPPPPPAEGNNPGEAPGNPPSFGPSMLVVLLPVALMLLSTCAAWILPAGGGLAAAAQFAGQPLVALLAATLLGLAVLGAGWSRAQLRGWCEDCLGPIAGILLVVGAGGGFNRVLLASGVGGAVAAWAGAVGLSPIMLGWLAAAGIRVATGSATVAVTTAAGLVAPMLASAPHLSKELLVLAMASGSLILSHVNDGGFWLVKEYLKLDLPQTFKTWTVVETAISLLGLLAVLFLNALVGG